MQIIRMLTEKCRNQEAVIDELELREQEYAELEGEADLLRQQVIFFLIDFSLIGNQSVG